MDFRAEAIEKLKENDIGMTSMEVYIQGYIDGRIKTISENKDNESNKKTERNMGEPNV